MRVFLAFVAGFVSTLVFHQGLLALLHRAGAWPRPAYSMNPTWPLGLPQVLSTALWAGLWAIALAFLLARWPTGAGYWLGWLLAGSIAPTIVAFLVVFPLKGLAGGWNVKLILGGLMINGVWALGTALVLRLLRLVPSSARGSLGVLGALLIASPAAADRTIPYADMHGMFERIERLGGGKYVKARARLTSADPEVPTEAIRLVILGQSGEIAVPVASDGTTLFPVRADLLAENPPVRTNVAAGKLELNVSLAVEAQPTQRFPYALMIEMVDEAKAIIRRQGLLARMLLPDFEELVVTFPAGVEATATIGDPDGALRLAADAAGNVVIQDRRDWRRENPLVELSQLPLRIALRAG